MPAATLQRDAVAGGDRVQTRIRAILGGYAAEQDGEKEFAGLPGMTPIETKEF
jgi:hypothetical protein